MSSVEHPTVAGGGLRTAATAPSKRMSERRLGRRPFFIGMSCSYALAFSLLSIYGFSGAIPMTVAIGYFLAGMAGISLFVLLSETGFNNRFADDNLTEAQVFVNILIQLVFIVVAPQIAFAFLGVMFLIISFGTMRLSLTRSTIIWASMTVAILAVAFSMNERLGMASETPLEKLAAILCFSLTAGQCVLVGVHGNKLRTLLYNKSVELRQANRRISELADIDELTGAYNRRCIMRLLEQDIERARDTGTSCAVAMIDLDWFKRINDEFGHPAGDEVLRTFAITVFANIRDSDKFGRYGGEEFMLILSPTPDDAGHATVDRLRELISDIDWSGITPGVKVTISSGIAVLRTNEQSDGLLVRADAALYRAKNSGRNRVLMA